MIQQLNLFIIHNNSNLIQQNNNSQHIIIKKQEKASIKQLLNKSIIHSINKKFKKLIYLIHLFHQPNQPTNHSKMILNSQTMSNQSQSFNDYRYQKALKQISKLINVNRQIKIESEKCRGEFEQLAIKNAQLLQINTSLQEQNTMLRKQLQQLNATYSQLQQFCKKAEHQQKQLIKSNQMQSQQKLQTQQRHQTEIQQLQHHYQQQIDKMQLQLHNKDQIITELKLKLQQLNQLEAENDKLHQRYEVALKQNDDLNKKCAQLNQTLINTSTQIKHEPNQQLINKLKINQEWIKSLNQQNYNLKQKVFEQQYKKQRQKCSQTLLKNVKDTNALINLSSTNANQVLIRQYLKQVQKKLKKIQEEKQKLQNKYNKLKGRNHQLQIKNNSMEKDVNLLTIKLSGYEQLAERQQRQIQQMIQEYHKQMDKVIAIKKKPKSSQPNTHDQQNNHPNIATSSQSEKQLKSLVQQMQKQIIQKQTQSQQKDRLIQYLQTKVFSLQTQRAQLQRVNGEIEQELETSQTLMMDLSKTSKNYNKPQNLILRTHSFSKNGGKVFMINGKKYETQVLKSKSSDESKDRSEQPNSVENINTQSQQVSSVKKIAFPAGQLSYTTSQRNYSTQTNILNPQRA